MAVLRDRWRNHALRVSAKNPMNSEGVIFDGVPGGMERTEKYFNEEIQGAMAAVNNRVGMKRIV